MSSIPLLLMIFLMLSLSSLAVFWARRLGIPHTVLLVALGVAIGFIATIPGFSFLNALQLTPELLFYVFLPTLIFESAYNINLRKLYEDKMPVILLSVIGLLISAGLIGLALYFIFGFLGFHVPLIITLLFGALISATDTAAVLALFKEYGAPRRLALIFEGESLFNDATAVALFLILLQIAVVGFSGFSTVMEGFIAFTLMMVNGIIFGLIAGVIFSELVGRTRDNEAASITLTIVLAHVTFLSAELISHYWVIGGQHIYVAPIIATTVASLVMGNFGRSKIHPRAEEFVEKLWSQMAFIVNSVIFILIGLYFVSVPLDQPVVLVSIIIAIVVVALARTLAVYLPIGAFNFFASPERKVPREWQHLLSWGSLRGAFAVVLVLMVPEDLTVAGWNFPISLHDFLLALTLGCIFATTFIKATLMQKVMKKLKLDVPTDIESLEYQEARALIHRTVNERLTYYKDRGYVSELAFVELSRSHAKEYDEAVSLVKKLDSGLLDDLTKRVIRIYAIGIEKRHLKDLYHYDEVSEFVFKRIMHKLSLQLESIERGDIESSARIHTDGAGDIIDSIVMRIAAFFSPRSKEDKFLDSYMYYRAQAIVSRKVLKELGELSSDDAESIFTKEAYEHAIYIYNSFRDQTKSKIDLMSNECPAVVEKIERDLAVRGVEKVEEKTLDELYERELVTPKLYLNLKKELNIRHS